MVSSTNISENTVLVSLELVGVVRAVLKWRREKGSNSWSLYWVEPSRVYGPQKWPTDIE